MQFFHSLAFASSFLNMGYATSIIIIVVSLISVCAEGGGHKKMKSAHLEFNLHDNVNFTGYVVLKGPGSTPMTPLAGAFGTTYVFHDPITEKASDFKVGIAQGALIISSFDGLTTFVVVTVSLNNTRYHGSLSFVGLVTSTVASKVPIVGGTDDFMFAQGYMYMMPANNPTTYNITYELDLHIYWPLHKSH